MRSNVIFLLTCEGGQSCLVNISEEPINYTCFSLPNSTVLAIANNNARYILASTMTNSAAIVTIHDILLQSTVYLLNTTIIYGADFGPGNKFAYVATNNGIDFVNIVMALEGASAENFTHRVNIPACSECPPVVFLNSTIALVTSSTLENNQLQSFDLSSWPPLNLMNKTLIKQPKLYWHDDQYNDIIEPTPTVTSTTLISLSSLPLSLFSKPIPTVFPSNNTGSGDSGDNDSGNDADSGDDAGKGGLSSGTIAGIVGVVGTVLIVTITVAIVVKALHHLQWEKNSLPE